MTKKISYCVLALIVAIGCYSCEDNLDSPVSVNPGLKANSRVLVELFSNVMCVACVQSANYCDEISALKNVTINDTNVIVINIHTSIFPGDPFYTFNGAMNAKRINYYNVLFNPAGFLMGSLMTAPFSAEQWTNQINRQLTKTNAISIILNNAVDTLSRTGILNVTAGQINGSPESNLKLYIVITESNLYYNSPSGKTIYNNILRQMLTDFDGEDIIVNQGQPVSLVKEYTIDNRVVLKNSQIIVFIQNNSTKEVLCAEKVKILN